MGWPDVGFSKLIDIKAYIKVFICLPKEAERRDLPMYLADWVSKRALKCTDEAYLIIVMSRDRRRKEAERLKLKALLSITEAN